MRVVGLQECRRRGPSHKLHVSPGQPAECSLATSPCVQTEVASLRRALATTESERDQLRHETEATAREADALQARGGHACSAAATAAAASLVPSAIDVCVPHRPPPGAAVLCAAILT